MGRFWVDPASLAPTSTRRIWLHCEVTAPLIVTNVGLHFWVTAWHDAMSFMLFAVIGHDRVAS